MNTNKDIPNQKTQQFQEELNELLKRYQYALVPEIVVTKSGVTPQITIHDVIPSKGNVVSSEETLSGASGAIVTGKKKNK